MHFNKRQYYYPTQPHLIFDFQCYCYLKIRYPCQLPSLPPATLLALSCVYSDSRHMLSMLLFSVLCLSHEIFLMFNVYMLYTCSVLKNATRIYESIDTYLLLENMEFTQPKLVNITCCLASCHEIRDR